MRCASGVVRHIGRDRFLAGCAGVLKYGEDCAGEFGEALRREGYGGFACVVCNGGPEEKGHDPEKVAGKFWELYGRRGNGILKWDVGGAKPSLASRGAFRAGVSIDLIGF